jgi:YVTN family beta-propeller protein
MRIVTVHGPIPPEPPEPPRPPIFAYVTNADDDTVSVIDTSTNTVIGAPIPVGDSPRAIAITPDGTRAYVTNSGDGTVSVIDTITNTVIGAPIPVGNFPLGIAITPSGI